MSPRLVPLRHRVAALLYLCLSLMPSLPPFSHAEEPAADVASALPTPMLQFATDFQHDCRAEFQSTGTVDWQPGQLTLQPGATIRKELNGNWQGEWQFDLAVVSVKTPNLEAAVADFRWQVTMAGANSWAIIWQPLENGA